jgi:hypothetical protein
VQSAEELVVMAKKARIKTKELEDLVDVFEGAYMFVQPRPETVGIENDRIHVSYDGLRTVKPLTHSDLFTSLAKLAAHGSPSEAKIKRWVARFGLPVSGSQPELDGVVPAGKLPRYKPLTMKVDDFRTEARRAHNLLSLYIVIRGRDATEIRRMIRRLSRNPKEASPLDQEFLERVRANQHSLLLDEPGDKRRSRYREAFPINRDELGITGTMARHREFVNMMTVLAAESALGEITTGLVSSVRLRAGVQRWEGLTPSWQCSDLLSAVHLEFFLLVTKSKSIRFCKNPPCRQPFTPDSNKHVFCSESCRSNARHYLVS